MSGTNPVATYNAPNNTTQSATAYKANIDAACAVFQRSADSFAPRQTTVPAMTVSLDAGHLFSGSILTEVTAQTTGTITAPVGNPRIDRVVIDRITGAVSVITGTPAGSPSAPAITAGKLPVARVLLQTTSTSIINSMITDERDLSGAGQPMGTRATIASATTTDLGSTESNNISVTGTTTITSFGTTASADYGPVTIAFAGALTLTYNATSMILPGSASIVTVAGDSCEAIPLGSGNWQVLSYSRASGAALVAPVVTAPVVGNPRNLKVVQTSSTVITVTYDELVVKTALGGTAYLSVNRSLTLNIATTGAGGMDTGSAPTSSALYVYVIHNPTTGNPALLGTVAGTGQTIYPGSSMPSGFTASCKVSSLVMNGSAQFQSFYQYGGKVAVPVTVWVGSGSSNSAVLPPDALFCSGYVNSLSNGSAGSYGPDSGQSVGGMNEGATGSTTRTDSNFADLLIATAQTLYGSGVNLFISGYTLWN